LAAVDPEEVDSEAVDLAEVDSEAVDLAETVVSAVVEKDTHSKATARVDLAAVDPEEVDSEAVDLAAVDSEVVDSEVVDSAGVERNLGAQNIDGNISSKTDSNSVVIAMRSKCACFNNYRSAEGINRAKHSIDLALYR
jgi:hypothetical protein